MNAGDKNLGFMLNQKYVCINQGAIINNEIVPMVSQEDAFKYPIRFKIDDNNILHTDGQIDFKLPYLEKLVYGTPKNKIILSVENDMRFIIHISEIFQNVPIIYLCNETNNWTIHK